MISVRRSAYAAILTLLSFAAIHYVLFVLPDPERWYYNMTASGFAPFMTAITFATYAIPAWLVSYGLLALLGIGKPPSRVPDEIGKTRPSS